MRLQTIMSAARGWIDASTIILVSSKNSLENTIGLGECYKNEKVVPGWPKSDDYDYRILMMKRSLKSGFFPSAYVFPGGIADDHDFNLEWSNYLSIKNDLSKLNVEHGIRPPMFVNLNDKKLSSVIAYRLTAIRELFEECGILLCKRIGDKEPSVFDLESFRQEVNKRPSSFLELCKKFSVIPDVESLYEWSNWLTPNHLQDPGVRNRRYDTAFYLAVTDDFLYSKGSDKREVEHCQWVTPTSVNEEFEKSNIFLPPPQIYELSRLANFTKHSNIKEFSIDRQKHGIERWMPVRISCSDGITACLPGDSAYPSSEDLDLYGERPAIKVEETMEKHNSKTKNLNRFHIVAPSVTSITCNIANFGFPLPKLRHHNSSL